VTNGEAAAGFDFFQGVSMAYSGGQSKGQGGHGAQRKAHECSYKNENES
jgi:hypothetical protein